MNVASKQLCQELYELSGWDAGDKYWNEQYVGIETKWYVMNHKVVASGRNEGLDTGIPAYDLGYLLRKLPEWIDDEGTTEEKSYPFIIEHKRAGYLDYESGGYSDLNCSADTPEDAACQLAIELFKQGILKPSDKEEA